MAAIAIKAFFKRILPDQAVRAGSRLLDRRDPDRRRKVAIVSELVRRHGPVVQAGPFAGTQLSLGRRSGHLAALLVGSYEEELHGVLEVLIARAPSKVIDVGCAEGYYVVGLARRLPQAAVHAFDIDPQARRLTREAARLNGVADRVTIDSRCGTQQLAELAGPDTLLVIDCEGCELELLRPDRAPALLSTALLVELHDFVQPGLSDELLARFRSSHTIETIHQRPRNSASYPATEGLPAEDRARAVHDGSRGDGNFWALLLPLPAP